MLTKVSFEEDCASPLLSFPVPVEIRTGTFVLLSFGLGEKCLSAFQWKF